MLRYVEVAVNVPQAAGVYHYHVPEGLETRLSVGCLLSVPFGGQTVQGVVLRLLDQPQVQDTKPVYDLIDPLPVVNAQQVELAQWIAENTLSPLAACLDAMIPPGLSQRAELQVEAFPSAPPAPPPGLTPLMQQVFELVSKRGKLRAGQLDAAFPRQNWRASVQSLARRGLVIAHSVLPPPGVRPKLVRTVQIACSPEMVEEKLSQLSRFDVVAARRKSVLDLLMREPWPVEVAWVFAQCGCTQPDLERLAELGLVVFGETEIYRDPLQRMTVTPSEPPALTDDQQRIWQTLCAAINTANSSPAALPRPFLLYGVTGAGKTEIYLHAVAETLRLGKQAIVMVPEIALTPQTLRRFQARFPGQVGVLHSRLSPGERYDTWRRARLGLLPVIVGPRSALFAPLPRLGLIVIDECHDDSYYQSEKLPYYHAVQTALAYANMQKAVVVLGSATPDITQNYYADQGRWQRLSLPVRLLAHRQAVEQQAASLNLSIGTLAGEGEAANLRLPQVNIVDMRDELKSGNRSIFSRALQVALKEVLEKRQQAILFLNRRGTATYVFCRECGEAIHCPHCDRPLTFHNPQSALICHSCGYQRRAPDKCPGCGSKQIRHFGTGTERVETEVKAMFPEAVTLRWDYETTRQKDSHDIILSHFAGHRADILVGTQMLAKGLDLPLITLVGVVLADVGLNLPDYRASERTFQVLTQVAGRAGRSPLGGQVVLQTFQPDSYVIRAASQHDYFGFYREELNYRKQIGYPPFYRLARLEYRHLEPEQAEAAARSLGDHIRDWIKKDNRRATEMIGPVPCFFGKQAGYSRWQIVLRGPDPAGLIRQCTRGPRERLLDGWRTEVDPPSLL